MDNNVDSLDGQNHVAKAGSMVGLNEVVAKTSSVDVGKRSPVQN